MITIISFIFLFFYFFTLLSHDSVMTKNLNKQKEKLKNI